VPTEVLAGSSSTAMLRSQVITFLIRFSALKVNYQVPEHTFERGEADAQPSYCMLEMFHPDMDAAKAPAGVFFFFFLFFF
jgi:hypothetical protein